MDRLHPIKIINKGKVVIHLLLFQQFSTPTSNLYKIFNKLIPTTTKIKKSAKAYQVKQIGKIKIVGLIIMSVDFIPNWLIYSFRK
jgi:hypothetical protein